MKATVIATERGNRFLCKNTFAGEMTAELLRAPEDATYEPFTITRDGNVIAQGTIRWVGTHGECPMFYFTTRLPTHPTLTVWHELPAQELQAGDSLEVLPDSGKESSQLFDRHMWLALTIPCHTTSSDRHKQTK